MRRINFSIMQLMLGLVIVSPVQAQQPTEYQIKVSPQELDLVGKGLGLLPFNDVAPLVQKLRNQVIEQQTPNKPTGGPVADPEKK